VAGTLLGARFHGRLRAGFNVAGFCPDHAARHSPADRRRPAFEHGLRASSREGGDIVIAVGIILLIIGIVAKIGIVWTAGFVILVLGLIALLLGTTGHGIGGRRHYF